MLNMDKLYESVAAKGHVCVGLDTAPSYVPPAILKTAASEADAVLRYNLALIDATADTAACY
jgi:orotidine-5'-phosphate decarboxylase